MPLAEFYTLLAFSMLGAMFVGAAGDLVMIFLGIELSSLSTYVADRLRPRRRDARSKARSSISCSACFATAILLYGMAWIYGVTGIDPPGRDRAALARVVAGQRQPSRRCCWRCCCWWSGLGFKIAAVPFHMWTPDAYQGAPTPVTAFMSVGAESGRASRPWCASWFEALGPTARPVAAR